NSENAPDILAFEIPKACQAIVGTSNQIDSAFNQLNWNKQCSCGGFLSCHSQMRLLTEVPRRTQNRILIPCPTSLEISRPTAAMTDAACRSEAAWNPASRICPAASTW